MAAAITAALVSGALVAAQPAAPAGEQVYDIHLIERLVGTERDTITAAGAGQHLESRLAIVDRGTPLDVSASVTVAGDYTPRAVTVTGKTYRFVNVDLAVRIENGRAQVRNGGATTTEDAVAPFAVTRGYAPLAARAWLIKYWEDHGRPVVLPSVPRAASDGIRISPRGEDRVMAGGTARRLRRFAVDGVVWGRETVWLDDADRLAALVTRIHILPMTAVRHDLREALPALQAAAVADRMADLEAMRAATPTVADGEFALVGARVASGAGAVLEDATVVVRAGRIAAVGRRAATRVPAGVRAVPAQGTTVVPGLWDMHAHASQIEWAPAYLAAGVTTIRDMGGETRYLTALRDVLETGRGLGPRVLLAGLVDGPGTDGFGASVAATPEDGRALVDRFHGDGFAQMKLYTLLAPDVVSAIAARAHALGMTVTGHVPRALTPEEGLTRGMDQIAHLPVRGDAASADNRRLIAALANHDTVVDPTLSWTELLGRGPDTPLSAIEPAASRLPAPLAANYRSVTNARDVDMAAPLAAVSAMRQAGVTLVVGTDGAIPGLSVLREIELFVRAGFTPQQAIDAATRVPASVMGVLDETGTIEPGKRADLLVVDGNPLEDIAALRRTRWVSIGGRLHAAGDLAKAAGFGPAER